MITDFQEQIDKSDFISVLEDCITVLNQVIWFLRSEEEIPPTRQNFPLESRKLP